jgi:hypothetical protein
VTATPPFSPHFNVGRFDNTVGAADFAADVNSVIDTFDAAIGVLLEHVVSVSAAHAASPGELTVVSGAHAVTLPTAPPADTTCSVLALNAGCSVAVGGSDTITQGRATGGTTALVPGGTLVRLRYSGGIWYVADTSFAPYAIGINFTGTTGIPIGRGGQVTFDNIAYTEGTAVDADYNAGTGIWTCPVAGVYHIDSMCGLTNVGLVDNTVEFVIGLLGNDGSWIMGGLFVFADGSEEGTVTSLMSGDIPFNAGDVAYLQVSTSSPWNWSGYAQQNYLNIHRVT